ncbi:fructose PTS transporter subunit IIB [Propionibacterium acidifaciens]|uniref:PTS fructose transporter subunit IIB n=1 Tax=Propionibacterium acidifaciens TaxID=556499 RepID=UPI0028DC05FD|nr:fructose PTS transporter subunit IIB [Propionibacterium acidifaciens]
MMRLVAVTSCATGIAHSYMAAEALERLAQEHGLEVRVEIQGALGIENRLGPEDIANADVIILANDVAIADVERFASRKNATVKVSPQQVIQSPEALYRALVKRGLIGEEENE